MYKLEKIKLKKKLNIITSSKMFTKLSAVNTLLTKGFLQKLTLAVLIHFQAIMC